MEEQGPQQAGCLHPIYPRPGDQGQHTIALALGAAENPHAPDHVDLRLLQARPPNPLGVSESWTSRLRQHLAQLPAPVVQGSNILSKDRRQRSAGGEAQGQRESEDKVSEFRRQGWDTTAAGERSETRTPICRQPRPAGPISRRRFCWKGRKPLPRKDLPSRDHRLTGCSGKASPSFPAGKRVRSLNRHSVGFFPAQHRPPLCTAARGPGPRKLLGAHTEKSGGKVTRRITLAWMTLIPCQDNHELSTSV